MPSPASRDAELNARTTTSVEAVSETSEGCSGAHQRHILPVQLLGATSVQSRYSFSKRKPCSRSVRAACGVL
jgi:hypothetical protein